MNAINDPKNAKKGTNKAKNDPKNAKNTKNHKNLENL